MIIQKGFGYLPTTDLTIASGKQYTFLFSAWSSAASFVQPLQDAVGAYSTGLSVSGSGLTTITVSLIPSYDMPLSAWKNLFSEAGLTDMTDITVGTFSQDTGFHPIQNIETYWGPKLEAAANALAPGFSWVKTIAIAGAVIVGGVLIMTYVPKPHYKDNPRRKQRR